MTDQEYADLLLAARDYLYNKIRAVLPAECEMERRFMGAGSVNVNDWAASIVKPDGTIRIFIMTISGLGTSDLAKTAGAKNFKPEMKISYELFHDCGQGNDAGVTQTAFESDALKLQFAIETNRDLEPKGKIDSYTFTLGVAQSRTSLHFARGEMIINFREIRY